MTAPSILPRSSTPSHAGKHAPPAGSRGRGGRAVLDWLDSTDPGLMRLRLAAEIVVMIGVVLAAEWVFVRATGALQTPIPAGAKPAVATELWTLNHALMVIALMLGAILALISGFGVSMEATARGQLITLLFLPLPLIATLAGGLALHVRLASLASLAVVLAIGTYCRRFGPRGFNGGALAFMGAFLGFFIQDYVKLGNFGWLVAEIWLAMAVIITVHFAFFRPRPGAALRRMQRSYAARAQQVASEIAEQYQATIRSGGDPARTERARLDLPGALSVTLGIGALTYGLSQASADGWGSASVVAALAAAAVLVAGFVAAEAASPRPLIPLALFRPRGLRVGNVLMLCMGASMTAVFFFVSLYLQQALGYSALRTGLALLPITVVLIAGGLASRQLVPVLGPRRLLVIGGLTAAAGTAWLALAPARPAYLAHILGPSLVAGAGISFMLLAVTLAGTAGVDPGDAGAAAGLLNTSRQLGGAIGLGVLSTVAATATARAAHHATYVAALVHGYHAAFLGGAAVMLIAALAALALPPLTGRAAPAGGRRRRSGRRAGAAR